MNWKHGLALLMAMLLVVCGCATTKTENDFAKAKAERDAFLKEAKEAENIEKTNVLEVDALTAVSTALYRKTGGAMRDFLEASMGDQMTAEMIMFLTTYQINAKEDKEAVAKSLEERKQKAAAIIKEYGTSEQQQTMSPEALIAAAEGQMKIEDYKEYAKGLALAKDKAAFTANAKKDSETWAKIQEGGRLFQDRKAKMEQSAETLQATNPEVTAALAKLQQTNALLTKELADVTAALAELMNNPVFQQELVLQAKLKSPFGDKEAVNQELAALRASADYKKIAPQRDELMAKKELLEKALAVLGKGVGKQLAFTAKAIPYAWNQWQDMKNYPPAE